MIIQPRRLKLWYESIPKPFRSRWIIGLLFLGGLVSVGFGVYRAIALSSTAPAKNADLLTTTVQQKNLPITLSANGTIKPQRTINLSPKSSGYLKQLLIRQFYTACAFAEILEKTVLTYDQHRTIKRTFTRDLQPD
jgi:HlyD family secretion protein